MYVYVVLASVCTLCILYLVYVYVVLASVCTFDMRHSLLQGSTKELSSSLQKGVSEVGVYVLMV